MFLSRIPRTARCYNSNLVLGSFRRLVSSGEATDKTSTSSQQLFVGNALDELLDDWSKETYSSASDDTLKTDFKRDDGMMRDLFKDLESNVAHISERSYNPEREKATLMDVLSSASNPLVETPHFSSPIRAETLTDADFEKREEARKQMIGALQPSFDAINETIRTDDEMVTFIRENIIEEFKQESRTTPFTKKTSLSEIRAKSLDTPLEPLVCRESISTLLEFGLTSLVNDFGSFEEARYIFESIRRDSMRAGSEKCTQELYVHGCDSYVYVSMLSLVWKNTSNTTLVAQLLKEMLTSGIRLDIKAKIIILQIQNELHMTTNEQSVILLHSKRDANFISNVTEEREKLERRAKVKAAQSRDEARGFVRPTHAG
ncbi:unnamed protein product [Kuraishia capsulata CBS 1993]|uniref:Mtf2-like C-terminal domain-containing protein n=1 Tax=Kuraishia capsulata CBS 1993 TaxID=1382522 RepID=W6MNL0_9ASCO|nr:uncharacterized protein KUCA_T00003842001 [Kuraishia capsulata CBS 1993]CDK27863.1 unnamed protein product [Kuraishia capsulata CBS 1993]